MLSSKRRVRASTSDSTSAIGSPLPEARPARRPDRPAVRRGAAELLLDAQQLVVLGDAVGARRRAGLDLPGVDGDGNVGDRRVFGLAGAVADDAREAAAPR